MPRFEDMVEWNPRRDVDLIVHDYEVRDDEENQANQREEVDQLRST